MLINVEKDNGYQDGQNIQRNLCKGKQGNDDRNNLSYLLPTSYLEFQGQKIFQNSVSALISTISSNSLHYMR